ncbi:hypothetical protein REPUB_Repub02eG0164900 [Reevesia pubescens]
MESQGSTSKTVTSQTYWGVKKESENSQLEKGDCLLVGFESNLSKTVLIDWQQNDLSELIEIWDQWGKPMQDGFERKYGSSCYFLPIQIDKPLMEATLPFWDPSYRCFTFNQEDMTPTLEEYSVLL